MENIKINGTSLSVEKCGTGKPILFLSTTLIDKEYWNYYLSNISDEYTKISYDMRGYGKSEIPKENFAFDVLADDLNALIEYYKLDDITVVGHSLGGITCLKYIEKYGYSKIRKLIMVSCAGALTLPFIYEDLSDPSKREAVVDMANRYYASMFCGEKFTELKEELVKNWKTVPHMTYQRHHYIKDRVPQLDDYPIKIDIPTLLIYGAEDKVVTEKGKDIFKNIFKDPQSVKIDGCGHMVPFEAKEKVLVILKNFI